MKASKVVPFDGELGTEEDDCCVFQESELLDGQRAGSRDELCIEPNGLQKYGESLRSESRKSSVSSAYIIEKESTEDSDLTAYLTINHEDQPSCEGSCCLVQANASLSTIKKWPNTTGTKGLVIIRQFPSKYFYSSHPGYSINSPVSSNYPSRCVSPRSPRTGTSPSEQKGPKIKPLFLGAVRKDKGLKNVRLFKSRIAAPMFIFLILVLTVAAMMYVYIKSLADNNHCNTVVLKSNTRHYNLNTSRALGFMVVGDFGGQEEAPYFTSGQFDSAAAMDIIAGQINAQFVVTLGDNFYYNGVKDVTSHRFQSTFEDVYTGENLQVDWFMTAGNHDYFQDICPQIEYTDESDRWEYPAKHYAASFSTIDGVTMDLIMVDSVDLAGTTNLENWRGDPFNPLAYVANPKFEEKWHWIERKMKQSHAQYLFVGTHYPVYSVCKNGNVALMEKRMKPLVQKYGAHLMSGHDHCLEHIEEKGVHYFVSGIGSECCYEGSNLGGVADGALQWYLSDDHGGSEVTGGFTSFVLTSTSMEAVFYVQNGTALYRTGPIFPREM